VHTCDFLMTACSKAVSPALADVTLQFPDTFSRHRFSARVLNVLSALHPGEVMVPWNEPEVKPVARFTNRSTVKLPCALANRPVPPVMVLISVMPATPAVTSLDPATVV
jgi:hypothetical protein